ncbi:MAG: hypothetical protein A2284_06550 [Deltaproteobacteria bacterium RIFOXYA12_FULL_61_11]|nr:MAG: hypothetical protein A2284_06550 [Deltaproteobacteria bacterium RIFOXYA12_FULL_61_11]
MPLCTRTLPAFLLLLVFVSYEPVQASSLPRELENLDPEATSAELRRAYGRSGRLQATLRNAMQQVGGFVQHCTGGACPPGLFGNSSNHRSILEATAGRCDLEQIIAVGERNLLWLNTINKTRSPEQQLAFTSPKLQAKMGIPIDQPKRYGHRSICTKLERVVSTMPEDMKTVLFGKGELPEDPIVPEKTYLEQGRSLDELYQTTLRWKMFEPHRDHFTRLSVMDIRGYYFLQRVKNLENELADFSGLTPQLQEQYRTWLLQLCANASVVAGEGFTRAEQCKGLFETALADEALPAYYERFVVAGAAVYRTYFDIQNPRENLDWSRVDHQAEVTFLDPRQQPVRDFLQTNLEDEFRYQEWQLHLRFVKRGAGVPRVLFEANAAPHVNGIGGDTITMNANDSLDEFGTRWAIRHEFGHLLGFPDCYFEFFDKTVEEMVTYQIDPTDLMCSRAGHFTKRMYRELEAVYGEEVEVAIR